MARITIDGKTHYTDGCLPAAGQTLPRFTLTNTHWTDVTLQSYGSSHKVIEVFPTVHAPGVAAHLRALVASMREYPRALLLVVSNDLPAALDRWRSAEQLHSVVALSAFRSERFALSCGMSIRTGRYRGLTARASLIVDGQDRVLHAELARDLDEALEAVAPDPASAAVASARPRAVTVRSDTPVTV